MWTCRNCNARFAFDQAEAQIDESGYFHLSWLRLPEQAGEHRSRRNGGCPQFVQRAEASIMVQPPPGRQGGLLPPQHISVEPLLKGGLSETEALEYILKIVSLGVEGTEVGSG
jgi:hypothetical protein